MMSSRPAAVNEDSGKELPGSLRWTTTIAEGVICTVAGGRPR